VYDANDVLPTIDSMWKELSEKISEYQQNGSGWVFSCIKEVCVHVADYQPLRGGSSYFPTPKHVAVKKAVLNIRNLDDHKCFLWCCIAAQHPAPHARCRLGYYRQFEYEYNVIGCTFPLQLHQVARFEKQNGLRINVLAIDGKRIFIAYASEQSQKLPLVELLQLSNVQGDTHYVLIRSMSRLLSTQISDNKRPKFFCNRCLNPFGSALLQKKHMRLCKTLRAQRVTLPHGDLSNLRFKNFKNQIESAFWIVCDFETIGVKRQGGESAHHTTRRINDQVPCGFCYMVWLF
jgi:hypothetical protein